MIPDAIEVRLKPKERAVLESRLRAATTEQRQLLRIRIVLEAADGSGTREIARELDTTPTTVSLWRGRFARERPDGLEDLPRSGTPPIYSEATDKRIRAVLDRPPPKGFARWNGPLIAKALGDVDVQYVWRSLRKQKIDLGGRKSWCESNDPEFARLPMWSASTWRRPTMPSSYVSTRNRQSRRWSAPFIESYDEDAEPFVWTKSKVHQRRVKGRRISDL